MGKQLQSVASREPTKAPPNAPKCIEGGASAVIVTNKDQKVLTVDNPDSLKEHYGHHVAVTGHIDGDKIHIDGVKIVVQASTTLCSDTNREAHKL